MQRHFTATVYVIEKESVLLLFHPKHGKWLPPGGHLEVNETPPECACREVLEETGLCIELIKEEHIWIDQQNAVSCERPYLCLIENIPEYNGIAAHQHVDFIYLGRPIGGTLLACGTKLRWFTLEDARQLKPDEIFADTQEIIASIMKQTSLSYTARGLKLGFW